MTKIQILFISFLLAFFSLKAQRASMVVGEEDKAKVSAYYYYINGKGMDVIRLALLPNKHGIGGFATNTFTPVLSNYNKRMEVVGENKLSELPLNTFFGHFVNLGGKGFLFTNKYDRKSKTINSYCQAIQLDNLNPEGQNIHLGDFVLGNNKGRFAESSNNLYLIEDDEINYDKQVVSYIHSSDSTKLLIAVSELESATGKAALYLSVYNQQMKKLWERTAVLPFQQQLTELKSMSVTNNGEVGAFVKVYKTEKRKSSRNDGEGSVEFHSELLLFDQNNPDYRSVPINMDNYHLHSAVVTDSRDGQLHVFGLYQQQPGGNCQGYFRGIINPSSKEQVSTKQTPFATELVNTIIAEKQAASKGAAGIGNEYRIVGVVERNGSTDYLLEFFKIKESISSERSSFWYYHGNILNIHVEGNDGTSIVTKLPRYQMTSSLNIFGGVKPIVQNDKLILLFNDDNANIGKKAGDSPRPGLLVYPVVLQMAVVENSGTVKRSMVNNPSNGFFLTAVREAVSLGSNSLAVNLYGVMSAGSSKIIPGVITIK